MKRTAWISLALSQILLVAAVLPPIASTSRASVFAKHNLVAWCIVPFDAAKRRPEQRAQMLERLGIKRLAYDFRDEHIRTFDREIDALQKHRIELTAFWVSTDLEPEKNTVIYTILDLIRRRGLNTQLWVSVRGTADESFTKLTQEERIVQVAEPISYIAKKAKELDCLVGLYNHGGWYGEPENQIAIIRQVKMDNVGIVYNFHHGHDHIDPFPELLKTMQPYLLCLNLNGMRKGAPKILPLGEGDHELEMLKVVQTSGYKGPIGILDHRDELDAEVSLKQNIDGLQRLISALGDEEALKTY